MAQPPRVVGFHSPLRVENIDGLHVKLFEPLVYYSAIEQLGWITVPAGFVTDYASVPRGLWNLFPPNGKYAPAAVVHDYLYRRTLVDRQICDRVLLEGMESLSVSWITRRLIYRAVRLFGGAAREREVVSGIPVEAIHKLARKADRRVSEGRDRGGDRGKGRHDPEAAP